MKKREHILKTFFITICVTALLSGCGHVASARSLIRQAKHTYGKCTVVSTAETPDSTKVVLHDELQDFDYTISSTMNDITIDGSSFGSVPGTSDNFYMSLLAKIESNVGTKIADICKDHNAEYEFSAYGGDLLLTIRTATESEAIVCAEECAEVLQEQNLNNRLDDKLIVAEHIPDDTDWFGERFGSVKLPSTAWRTIEEENIDYYTEMAHEQTDPNAVFLRTKQGYFRDTGADLNRVVNVLGSDIPDDMNDPVTFYYFRSSKGQEYYLCDFVYNDKDDPNAFCWYTNYQP